MSFRKGSIRTTAVVWLLATTVKLIAATNGPLSPNEAIKTLSFADTDLRAELVAAEPDVISPVSVAWDEAGRMFVAEMRDYPNGTNGGTIRRLEDKDRDGRYETAIVFAERMPFPNSVLPWNGGVLVTAAPDLLFLKDTDGDGRSDERRVLFTGFGTGNQQLRVNGLTWGMDGWVYGANGRSDGNVHRPGQTNKYSLRGRDFRFRPATGEFETLAGRSQFGLGIDDWGNRFLSWNTIPLRHEVFPDRYLARNPKLSVSDVLADLLPAGDSGQVFPLTPTPMVFNNESTGHFNSLGGLNLYCGDALGAGYRGNAFVGETLRNLVHRRVLTPEGATFTARRVEQKSEFLRSADPWFHAVNFATGPDGALYVVDFYRLFVEHPDWVQRDTRDKVNWFEGSQHGRIWRIVRKDQRTKFPVRVVELAKASARELVDALEDSNGWRRSTAQRLLLERRDPAAIKSLRTLARKSKIAEGRVLALHTLAALNALDEEVLLVALKDRHPRVREQAILLAEARLANASPKPVSSVIALTEDNDDRVKLRALLALGFVQDEAKREPILARVLAENTNRWLRLAAISSSRALSKEQIAGFLPAPPRSLRPAPLLASPNPDRAGVLEQYTPALKLAGDRARGAGTFSRFCLACHYMQGHGQRIGPDLSGISTRPPEALLSDILDPSRQVVPEFAVYEFTLADGEVISGLFAGESETRIIARRVGLQDENFPRSQVKALRPTAKSLMPDGLETGLSVQDMADLIEFLRKPDGSLLSR